MKFKSIYKSCFWSKTDIWGCLLKKKNSFLHVKWDRILGVLSSRKRRRYQKLCKNYNLVGPTSRPNQPYKYPRWYFKNSLSNGVCVRRFYGDLRFEMLKSMCNKAKTVDSFMKCLESRLGINLYRLGFFSSVFESKQAILHGKVLVNGVKITFDHYILKPGDLIEFCPKFRSKLKSRMITRRKNINYSDRLKLNPTPFWIQTDYSNLSFIILCETNNAVFYPFRIDFDEVLNSSKYRY
ncbi:unnamed protein product [Dictyota dichotoma]|uniref:Ribosomal protein S4 n=1 Tax=Dictyota dichotoma TaxID=2876 RepID=Q2TUD0_DICDH|nr:ribosomal protein S4 [Dictyota dichotoma]AAS79066.1 ribosomal protein S4 [Dictyota dichotoma]